MYYNMQMLPFPFPNCMYEFMELKILGSAQRWARTMKNSPLFGSVSIDPLLLAQQDLSGKLARQNALPIMVSLYLLEY